MHKGLKPLPPLDVLRYHYRYDPDTGVLYKRQGWYNPKVKKILYKDEFKPCTNPKLTGYGQLKLYRIAWALHHGEDPFPYVIDHINRDPTDNRIANLRPVTPKENTANRSAAANACVSSRKPVQITYPDGRGTIVVDSLQTANRVLNRTTVGRIITRGGIVHYGKGRGAVDSGIRVRWAT